MSEQKVTNGDAREVVAQLLGEARFRRVYPSVPFPPTRASWGVVLGGFVARARVVVEEYGPLFADHVREHGPVVLGDGVVAVPSEPTDAMVEAMNLAWGRTLNNLISQGVAPVDAQRAADVASLRAALSVPAQDEETT